MALGTLALHQLETRLPKVISPEIHGIIDYCYVAFFATLAAATWKSHRKAAQAAAMSSALVLAESLFTNYKYGVKRVIPFSVHGQLDGGFAAASLGIPSIFGFEGTVPATLFHVSAFVSATVVGLTDWKGEQAPS